MNANNRKCHPLGWQLSSSCGALCIRKPRLRCATQLFSAVCVHGNSSELGDHIIHGQVGTVLVSKRKAVNNPIGIIAETRTIAGTEWDTWGFSLEQLYNLENECCRLYGEYLDCKSSVLFYSSFSDSFLQREFKPRSIGFMRGLLSFKDFRLGPLFWDSRELVLAPQQERPRATPPSSPLTPCWFQGANLNGPSSWGSGFISWASLQQERWGTIIPPIIHSFILSTVVFCFFAYDHDASHILVSSGYCMEQSTTNWVA